MKKQYLNIFKLSFITYIVAILARPYITAQIWADVSLFLFIIAIVYQLLFVSYLRKKENIKFFKAVFLYVVYAISSVGCYIIMDYIKIFFWGYRDCSLFGGSCGETYYGIEAIKNNDWKNLFYIPYLIFNIVLIVTYVFTNKLKGKGNDRNVK